MKHLIFTFLTLLFFATTGCTLSVSRVGLPLDNAIAQVGVGFKILPKADAFTFLRVAPLWLGDDYVALANLSAVSTSETNNGVALGGLLVAENGAGLSAALIDANQDHLGVRLGGIVCGQRQYGVQIGLVTYASSDSKVLQIGLLNIIEDDPTPLPFINWAWGSTDEDEE